MTIESSGSVRVSPTETSGDSEPPRRLVLRIIVWTAAIFAAVAIGLAWWAALEAQSPLKVRWRALEFTALELHARDFAADPGSLHLLALPDTSLANGEGTPVPGVAVHQLSEPIRQAVLKSEDLRLPVHLWSSVVIPYNSIAFAQACQLALDGERSQRIEYVVTACWNQFPDWRTIDAHGALLRLYAGDAIVRRTLLDACRLARSAHVYPSIGYFDAEVAPRRSFWDVDVADMTLPFPARADGLFAKEDFPSLEIVCSARVQTAPDDPAAWYYLSLAQLGLRRLEEARESVTHAMALSEDWQKRGADVLATIDRMGTPKGDDGNRD